MEFKVGDIVKHKASFLRSTGWYTSVPRDGIVRRTEDEMMMHSCVAVQWCDSDNEAGVPINKANIMHAGAWEPN